MTVVAQLAPAETFAPDAPPAPIVLTRLQARSPSSWRKKAILT
jgi:hypothetical protein